MRANLDYKVYPMKINPIHRPMAWGSEEWTVSVYPNMQSEIINGEFSGRPVDEVIKDYPLLIKILKSEQTLSVQVHPNDTQAKSLENEPRGKTEAWVVLRAEPGAKLIYGLREDIDKETFENAARAAENGQNDIEGLLRWMEVSEGDVLYIPAGTVHALGAGMEVYEVQQSSDRTYRLWDWGRVVNGSLRELHTEKGIKVTNISFSEGKRRGVRAHYSGYDEITFIDEDAFILKRLDISSEISPTCFTAESLLALTMLGSGSLLSGGTEERFTYGDTFLIPHFTEYSIIGNCSVICSYVRE